MPWRPCCAWCCWRRCWSLRWLGVQRGLSLCQALLRAQLASAGNVMILEKALTLELQHFEDSEFYEQADRVPGARPRAGP